MKPNETILDENDIHKLDNVIKNIKDPNARKKLENLRHKLQKKINKQKKEATETRNRKLKTAYIVAIPFAIIFAAVGVYYFLKKDRVANKQA